MTKLDAPSPDIASSLTVQNVLDRAVAIRPTGEALVGRSGRLTYNELDTAVNRAANALLALGITPGDRVSVSLPNDLAVAISLLAAARVGAIWVGMSRHLAGPEKAYIVADSGAQVLVADVATIGQLERADVVMPELQAIVRSDEDVSLDDWGSQCEASDCVRPTAAVDPLGPAAIAYTSGTTGFPKGVVLCHRSLVLQGSVFTTTRKIRTDSRYGVWMPLCNVQSCMLSFLTLAQVAGTTVLIDHSNAATIADWVERERITHLQSVAATLNDLTSNPAVTGEMLRTLEEITVGGADVPQTVIGNFLAMTGVHPAVGYGQTESAGAITMTPSGEASVPEGVGKPLPHLEVSVSDGSTPLPKGEVGEVRVRAKPTGPWAGLFTPMLGYWRRPAQSGEVLRDGWLYTGDLGYFNDDDVLFIKGRKIQMILRGGANVYPAEVERVLLDTKGVDAAVVFGVPDDRLGERVVAVVSFARLQPATVDGCLERCRAQLARYKCPDQIVAVDELPRNATGKVIRSEAVKFFEAATALGPS